MAVKIRLMRVGKKKQPTYRIVVADERSPRDGRSIETIGQYGPRQDPSLLELDGDRAIAWLHKGAQPTEQVLKLLAVSGVWERFETERGKPANIKRRTGSEKAPKREPKKAPAAPPAEAAAVAPAAEAPVAETPAEAPTDEAPAEAPADATPETTEEPAE